MWFNTFALHRAGIWQRVKVPRNSKVTFAIWVQILSAQENHWIDGQMVSGSGDLGNYQVPATAVARAKAAFSDRKP